MIDVYTGVGMYRVNSKADIVEIDVPLYAETLIESTNGKPFKVIGHSGLYTYWHQFLDEKRKCWRVYTKRHKEDIHVGRK